MTRFHITIECDSSKDRDLRETQSSGLSRYQEIAEEVAQRCGGRLLRSAVCEPGPWEKDPDVPDLGCPINGGPKRPIGNRELFDWTDLPDDI